MVKLSDVEMNKMRCLFNTAYGLAKNRKPFSDMELMCAIQVKNGLDLGSNCQNRLCARDFVVSINSTLQEENSNCVKASSFVSIFADGSTHQTICEQEVLYLRYIKDGEVKTVFASIEELDHSNALGIKAGIDSCLTKLGLTFEGLCDVKNDKPTLVCANFDGASVMQGLKSGTMKLILDQAPWVFPMHCVAHKLELAALDSVKQHSYLRKFEDTIKGIFNFYHQSFKRRREVKAIAAVLEEDLAHISGVKQVRWLASKTRAIKSLLQNLPMISSHLEHAASRNSSDEAAKAKGYLREVSSVKFVMMLHAVCEIFEITASLSEVFQQDDLLLIEVYGKVETHVLRLEELKHERGPKLKVYFLVLFLVL